MFPRSGLRGTLKLLGDRAVIEFVANDMDWQPGARVTVLLADGSTAVFEVEVPLTTRPGSVPSGTNIRLVLKGAGGLSGRPVAGIRLENGTMIRL